MVRIVNGQIETSGSGQLVKKSPLDKIAAFFWSLVNMLLIFFQTIVHPRPTSGGKFTDGARRPVGRVNHGGSSDTMVRPGGGG
mmetsp:Transcript_15086/g.34335  ORF Transcript_15086/g.34335 Transcript_15086/m.34335 type:complete len:83 (+) Transcript_15086:113-361(+)